MLQNAWARGRSEYGEPLSDGGQHSEETLPRRIELRSRVVAQENLVGALSTTNDNPSDNELVSASSTKRPLQFGECPLCTDEGEAN